MAMYLTRFSYTPETWARMIEKPEDSIETTVLLTVEELTDALKKAKSVRYRPPGA